MYFKIWAQNAFWAYLATHYKILALVGQSDPPETISGPKWLLRSKTDFGPSWTWASLTEAQLPLETLAIRVWALDRRLGCGRRRVTEAAARGGDAVARGR